MTKSTPVIMTFLRNRFVQVIVISSILVQVGIWVRNFAVLLFVMDKTNNNPLAVSMISVAEFAPIFIFSFIGGTYADRWRLKKTMVWCDLLSAFSVFMVLASIVFGTWQAVFLVTFVSAILSQFSQPSSMKLVKIHIPKEYIQSGMAIFQTMMAIFVIIGPMLGTIVYQRFGINTAVAIMGVAFLLSAAVLTFLPPDNVDKNEEMELNFWRELKDGFSYVLKRKTLTILGVIFAVAGLAVGIVQPLGVFIIVERLGLPKENLQWILVSNGAAMLIGGILVMGISKRISAQKLLMIGLFFNSISIVAIGLSTSWTITLISEFLNGLFMPCIQIGINTSILEITEEKFVGRVNGVLNPMFMGFMVITMSLTGWLKVQFSLVTLYIASALLFLVGMFFSIAILNVKYSNKVNDVL
jgi:MFS family permease